MTEQEPVQPDDGSASDTDDTGDPSPTADDEAVDILELRGLVAELAETLLDVPFDGITAVERAEDGGWRAVFEVVERSAVPDTQDTIGRYELLLSASGDLQEYSLKQRFSRSEMPGEAL